MLFHVDIKMEPFRHEDDDAFLHDIICESGEDAEYDGSQYLNDTGEGDADQSEQMTAQDDTAEVSIEIRTYIYMFNFMMNSVPTNVRCVWNVYFSRHPDRGRRNGNEAQRKGWRGIPPSPHCTQMVNQSLPRVLRQQSSINAGIMCVRISPSASSYGRKAKPPTMTMTSSQTQKSKARTTI